MTSKIYINEKCRLKVAMHNQGYDNSVVFHRRFVNDWSQDTTFTMVTASESISTCTKEQQSDDDSLSLSVTDNTSNNSTSFAIGDVATGNDSSSHTNMSMKQATPLSSRRLKRKYEPKEHYTRSKKNCMNNNEDETLSTSTKTSSSSKSMMDESSSSSKSTSTSTAQTMQTNSTTKSTCSSSISTRTTNPQEASSPVTILNLAILPSVVTILHPNEQQQQQRQTKKSDDDGESYGSESGNECQSP